MIGVGCGSPRGCSGGGGIPTPTITNSISFDGVNDRTIGSFIPMIGEDFSISTFVKMNNIATNVPFFGVSDALNSRPALLLGYRSSTGEVSASSWNAEWNNNAGGAIVADTDWHNLIVTYDYSAQTIKIYWDGVEIVNTASFGMTLVKMDVLFLGWARDWPNVGADYGDINLTDYKVYSEVLSVGNVATLQTLGASTGTEVQWYPITEAVGTTSGYITDIVSNQLQRLDNMTAPYGIVIDAP